MRKKTEQQISKQENRTVAVGRYVFFVYQTGKKHMHIVQSPCALMYVFHVWILIATSQPKMHNNPETKTTNNSKGPIFSIQFFLMLNRSMKSLWGQPTWNQIKPIQLELAEILLDKIPFGQRERQQCRDEFAKGQILLRDKFC